MGPASVGARPARRKQIAARARGSPAPSGARSCAAAAVPARTYKLVGGAQALARLGRPDGQARSSAQHTRRASTCWRPIWCARARPPTAGHDGARAPARSQRTSSPFCWRAQPPRRPIWRAAGSSYLAPPLGSPRPASAPSRPIHPYHCRAGRRLAARIPKRCAKAAAGHWRANARQKDKADERALGIPQGSPAKIPVLAGSLAGAGQRPPAFLIIAGRRGIKSGALESGRAGRCWRWRCLLALAAGAAVAFTFT